jgi:hypothetical protein
LVDVRGAGDAAQDGADIAGRDVLGGIDTKTSHAKASQIVQVASDGATHVVGSSGQICEVDELAVLYFEAILIIVNIAIASTVMKILILIETWIAIVLIASAGIAYAGSRCHVIDHDIGIDVNADCLAALHHVSEFGASSATALDAVAGDLVALPPWTTGDSDVFRWWRDLDASKAARPEVVLALACDIGPFPFKEMDEYCARRRECCLRGRFIVLWNAVVVVIPTLSKLASCESGYSECERERSMTEASRRSNHWPSNILLHQQHHETRHSNCYLQFRFSIAQAVIHQGGYGHSPLRVISLLDRKSSIRTKSAAIC